MQTADEPQQLSEAECAARLAPMWTAADVHPYWPADTKTVVELLRSGGGFDVDLALLEAWARSQQCGPVPQRNGRFEWVPSCVLLAAALCNASRRWIPLDPKHVHKMSAPELAEHQAAAVGQTIFKDIEAVDFRSLVGVISNTNEPELRNVLCVALMTKLKSAGIE